MERRSLLRAGVVAGGALALGGAAWKEALAAPAIPGASPYGPLQPADANGIALPAGFTSRVIARSGQAVAGTGYVWHGAPDGGACYPDGSGWIYVSNAELGSNAGGASAVRFDAAGAVTAAYRILGGTSYNCAGGATPWNTWLSCEEISKGYVFETDPYGTNAPVRRDAMGRFSHEAAACDPVHQMVYLTEDENDGCLYRFVPAVWGDLSAGVLQVAIGTSETATTLTWVNVPDPLATKKNTRKQVRGVKRFSGGEGACFAGGIVYFTTKGDNRVWAYDTATSKIDLSYDDSLISNPPLTGVDNIMGAGSGDLYVAEDGGNLEICIIAREGTVAPFLRVDGQSSSEITGPAFNPAGNRLYFSSQRGTTGSSSGGITYEVTGPFRA